MSEKQYTRSVSQWKSYSRCPEAFRLERIVRPRLPETPAAWTALGSAFHEAYETWELDDRRVPLATFFEHSYELEVEALKLKQPDLSQWMKRPNVKTVEQDIKLYAELGRKQAEAYQEHCEAAGWTLYELPNGLPALEVSFEIDFGGVVVRGTIDSILEWPDGRVTVRDLKTGNVEDDYRQLGVYRFVAVEQFGLDLRWGHYWYTKRGVGSDWKDLTRYTRPYLEEAFAELERGISGRVFLPRPSSQCSMCGVKPWCREQGWLDERSR